MSGLPPVITRTLRVICTQYCPHLLTPGILIPANTKHKQEKWVKYKRKTLKNVLIFPRFICYLAKIILDGWGLDCPILHNCSAKTLHFIEKLCLSKRLFDWLLFDSSDQIFNNSISAEQRTQPARTRSCNVNSWSCKFSNITWTKVSVNLNPL